ncbi:MAG: MarR family winged helix-turn-helix transcriptional regulator [bacterium]
MPGCVGLNIRKASRAVTQLYDAALQPAGLRVTQLSILAVASRMERATISKLGEALVMDRTTLTRNLQPLEKKGLIKIAPGEDRRTREVSLTGRGRKSLSKGIPLWEKAQKRMVGALGEDRWSRMLRDLTDAVAIAQGA